MPSSTCWPRRLSAQSCDDARRSCRNTSACSARLNTLRRLTHGPRLVDTVTSGEVVMMRAASSPSSRASSPMIRPNASWVEARLARRPTGSVAGTGIGRARMRLGARGERHGCEEPLELVGIDVETGEALPLLAVCDPVLLLELGHLLGRHQPGVIVLVAGERQPEALDRVGDEAVRPVVLDRLERLAHQIEIMAAEIGHEARELGVVVPGEQRRGCPADGRGRAPGAGASRRRP